MLLLCLTLSVVARSDHSFLCMGRFITVVVAFVVAPILFHHQEYKSLYTTGLLEMPLSFTLLLFTFLNYINGYLLRLIF